MTDPRPNLIFILADDLGYADLGCTGARDVHSNASDVSPRLDAKIILTTLEKVVRRHGVNANNYVTMEAFKGNAV